MNVGENGAIYFANHMQRRMHVQRAVQLSDNVCETFYLPPDFGGMPSFQEPNRMVAAFWDDLCMEFTLPSTEIRYGLRGTAPNREFVAEWRNIRHYPFIFQPDSG